MYFFSFIEYSKLTFVLSRKWNEELLSLACQALEKDLPLSAEAPGGMIQYRRSLTVSFFFKCYVEVLLRLQKQVRTDMLGVIITDVL